MKTVHSDLWIQSQEAKSVQLSQRATRYDLISYNNIFTDVTENDWAKDYIETLADKNIVSGYEDGTFGPYSPLTRAEAVAIINRVLVESTPIVTFTPNDIAGHLAEAEHSSCSK